MGIYADWQHDFEEGRKARMALQSEHESSKNASNIGELGPLGQNCERCIIHTVRRIDVTTDILVRIGC